MWFSEFRKVLLFSYKIQYVYVCAQSCLTLCNPLGYSLSGFSVHGIFQARILEWVAIPFSRGSSQPRDQTQVSCISGECFTIWAIREARTNQTKTKLKNPFGLWSTRGKSHGQRNLAGYRLWAHKSSARHSHQTTTTARSRKEILPTQWLFIKCETYWMIEEVI